MARIIKSNSKGELLLIEDVSLESLQKAVGGYIEIVSSQQKSYQRDVFIINENGRINNLPINLVASKMCGFEIVGDCVIATKEEMNMS